MLLDLSQAAQQPNPAVTWVAFSGKAHFLSRRCACRAEGAVEHRAGLCGRAVRGGARRRIGVLRGGGPVGGAALVERWRRVASCARCLLPAAQAGDLPRCGCCPLAKLGASSVRGYERR